MSRVGPETSFNQPSPAQALAERLNLKQLGHIRRPASAACPCSSQIGCWQ